VLTALLCTPFSNVLTSKAQEPKALTEKKGSASMIKDLPPSSKRYALLIGVSDYKSSDITSLPSAEKEVVHHSFCKFAEPSG
jgi:hypothetical protein